MTEKRFTIRPQDDYFGVNDCLQEFNVVNGIRTEIEAKWLCDLLNKQHETIERLKENINELLSVDIEEEVLEENKQLKTDNGAFIQDIEVFKEENTYLKLENEQLKHDLVLYEENNTNEVLNQLRIELTSRLNDCIEEFKQ